MRHFAPPAVERHARAETPETDAAPEPAFAPAPEPLRARAPEEIDKAIESGSGKPYEPVAVARDVSFDAMSRVEMELYNLNGVAIEATAERDYVDNGLAAHVLGYLGEVTKTEIDKHPELDYAQGDLVGDRQAFGDAVEQRFEAGRRSARTGTGTDE